MANIELKTLFDNFWKWRMLEFPEFSTFCGFKKYDNKLHDFSIESFNKKYKDSCEFLEKLQLIKKENKLCFDDEMNALLLEEHLRCFIDGFKHKMYSDTKVFFFSMNNKYSM